MFPLSVIWIFSPPLLTSEKPSTLAATSLLLILWPQYARNFYNMLEDFRNIPQYMDMMKKYFENFTNKKEVHNF